MTTFDFYDQVEQAMITPMIACSTRAARGCGSRVHTSLFAEAGCKVTGIDDDARHKQPRKTSALIMANMLRMKRTIGEARH